MWQSILDRRNVVFVEVSYVGEILGGDETRMEIIRGETFHSQSTVNPKKEHPVKYKVTDLSLEPVLCAVELM